MDVWDLDEHSSRGTTSEPTTEKNKGGDVKRTERMSPRVACSPSTDSPPQVARAHIDTFMSAHSLLPFSALDRRVNWTKVKSIGKKVSWGLTGAAIIGGGIHQGMTETGMRVLGLSAEF